MKKVDSAGMWTIKDNPITHDGVVKYSGRAIDGDGSLGLDPNKLYDVYRPMDELLKACESFNGKPLINDHEMVGTTGGTTLPDEKNIGGNIYNVRKDPNRDGYICADLSIFSDEIQQAVRDGKVELSLGYWCKYRPEKGVYKGQTYDFVQYDLEGNHIALVQNGRMGSGCKVCDHKEKTLVYDSMEGITMDAKNTLDALRERLAKATTDADEATLNAILAAMDGKKCKDEDPEAVKETEPSGDEDEPKDDAKDSDKDDETESLLERVEKSGSSDDDDGEAKDEDEKTESDDDDDTDAKDEGEESEDCDDKQKGTDANPLFSEVDALAQKVWRTYNTLNARACKEFIKSLHSAVEKLQKEFDNTNAARYSHDSAEGTFKDAMKEVSRRERLYKAVEPYTGAFDHDEMRLVDVAKYAAKKLKVAVVDGAEFEIVSAHIIGLNSCKKASPSAMDGAEGKGGLASYLGE